MPENRTTQLSQDRTTATGLISVAAVCVMLAAVTGSHWLVLTTIGLLVGSLLTIRRTLQGQPYAYWLAWAAGSVIAFLVSWVEPGLRFLEIPLACAMALVAAALFPLWWARRAEPTDR